MCPMKGAGFECFLVLPQVQWFFGRINAVARRPMEVKVDMDSMLSTQRHSIINVFEVGLADFQQFVRIGPTQVRERQAGKVEAPLGNQGKIAFMERGILALPPLDTLFRKIKAAPAREFAC